MYKVYGPRQTSIKAGKDQPPGLPKKRIRLVHPSKPQSQAATRAARLSWTDDTDTHLDVPDFLLKQNDVRESRRRPGQIGLGIIFATAFLLSFCGVFLVAHFMRADTGDLFSSLPTDKIVAFLSAEPEPETAILTATAGLAAQDDTTPAVTVPQTSVTDPAQPVVVAQNTATLETTVQSDAQTPAVGTESAAIDSAPERNGSNLANIEASGSSAKIGLLPTMIAIEKGRYIIPSAKPGDETHQLVPVDLEAFKISTTEVTREQWMACVVAGACSAAGFPDRYFHDNKLLLPVTSVTTEQLNGFIDWINTKRAPGEPPYRLPLEAEWIVAARGGANTHTEFAWGGEYDANQIRSSDRMMPVNHSNPVNGLFGMSDNAAERVSQCWIMRMSDGSCYRNLGVVRGAVPGRIDEQSASLTHRSSRATNIPYENIGFRLAQ